MPICIQDQLNGSLDGIVPDGLTVCSIKMASMVSLPLSSGERDPDHENVLKFPSFRRFILTRFENGSRETANLEIKFVFCQKISKRN